MRNLYFVVRRMVGPFAVAGLFAGLLSAGTVTYDLTTDWAANSNPNGVWTYAQGNTALPWQPAMIVDGNSCFAGSLGIGGGYAPGTEFGNNPACLPAFMKTTADAGNTNDYLSGDVIVHAWDPSNGQGEGEAHVIWTAPVTGTVNFTGALWYAHSVVHRSDDYFLTLGSTTLASGSVAWNTSDRTHLSSFADSGSIAVNAGDQINLLIQRSAGSVGAVAGIQLAITETSADTPEPATMLLGLAGLVAAAVAKKRCT